MIIFGKQYNDILVFTSLYLLIGAIVVSFGYWKNGCDIVSSSSEKDLCFSNSSIGDLYIYYDLVLILLWPLVLYLLLSEGVRI